MLTFEMPLLGSTPKDPEVYKTFVLERFIKEGKANVSQEQFEAEIAAVRATKENGEMEEKGKTGFLVHDGLASLSTHVLLGFFKSAARALVVVPGTEVSAGKMAKGGSAYIQAIDRGVFVWGPTERGFTPLIVEEGVEITDCERPLRAMTAQGERVALACSEMLPAGTKAEFIVRVFYKRFTDLAIMEMLDYGQYSGLGSWRNAGWGAFSHQTRINRRVMPDGTEVAEWPKSLSAAFDEDKPKSKPKSKAKAEPDADLAEE